MSSGDAKRGLTRRHALGAAGAAGAAYLLGTGARSLANGDSGATATPAAADCVLTPAETEGPYFVDERLARSDIRTDPATGTVEPGVPLQLTLTVLNHDDACAPVQGATVDIWHCNASGAYSDEQMNGTVGQKFLRGIQTTDANGQVIFTTIYPGWYQGRTVHIHFKIRTFSGSTKTFEFTSQLFFDESVNDAVETQSPYNTRGARTTKNANDGIFNSSLIVPVSSDGSGGYTGAFNVGVAGISSSGGGGDSKVDASLRSARFVEARNGRRELELNLVLGEKVSVAAALVRGGDAIANAHRKSLGAGKHTLALPLARSVDPGPARLDIVLGDGAGNRREIKRRLRVPAS